MLYSIYIINKDTVKSLVLGFKSMGVHSYPNTYAEVNYVTEEIHSNIKFCRPWMGRSFTYMYMSVGWLILMEPLDKIVSLVCSLERCHH